MTSRSALAALLRRHLEGKGVRVESPASTRVPTTLDDAAEFGAVLAGFHAAVDDFEVPGGAAWTALSRTTLAGGDPSWIERLYHDDPEDRTLLVRWWGGATEVLRASGPTDLGLCHGEAYPATCRRVDGDRLAVAELDWAGTGHRAYDLATFRWVLELHAPGDAGARFDDFLAGYAGVRTPPPLDGLQAWVAVRHLWSLRLAAGFAGTDELARRASFAAGWPL